MVWNSYLVPKFYLLLGRWGLSPGRHRAHLSIGPQQAGASSCEWSLLILKMVSPLRPSDLAESKPEDFEGCFHGDGKKMIS